MTGSPEQCGCERGMCLWALQLGSKWPLCASGLRFSHLHPDDQPDPGSTSLAADMKTGSWAAEPQQAPSRGWHFCSGPAALAPTLRQPHICLFNQGALARLLTLSHPICCAQDPRCFTTRANSHTINNGTSGPGDLEECIFR